MQSAQVEMIYSFQNKDLYVLYRPSSFSQCEKGRREGSLILTVFSKYKFGTVNVNHLTELLSRRHRVFIIWKSKNPVSTDDTKKQNLTQPIFNHHEWMVIALEFITFTSRIWKLKWHTNHLTAIKLNALTTYLLRSLTFKLQKWNKAGLGWHLVAACCCLHAYMHSSYSNSRRR